jgi:hypothetical protein
MDLLNLLTTLVNTVPVLGPAIPYVGAAGLVSAAITAAVPAPASGPLVPVWTVMNWLALNVGNAKNAPKA